MPRIAESSFGTLLRQHRRAAHLTQEGLAERAGISARSVSDLERGLSRMPHSETLLALVRALALSGVQRAEFLASAQEQPVVSKASLALPPVPAALSPIVGRERDEAALCHLLQRDTTRFVTLVGPVGVGKTRLAFQVARSIQEYYTDGVVFIFLEAIREPQLVLPAIAQALKLSEGRQKDVLQTLTTALHDLRLLLILDNCEQVLGAAGDLLALLSRCPALKMLTTSRARWRVRGEQLFPLAPLGVPALPFAGPLEQCEQYGAVALFLQCVRAIQPDFQLSPAQAPVVAELCARLDGLPLAIELAAARFPLFSPPHLLERMGSSERAGVLQVLTGRLTSGPERHQSLRIAIGWSYELLNAAEQQLFCALCIFEGSISLDALLAICARDISDEHVLLEHLETLLAQCLVYRIAPDEMRFRVLETIRAYGLEQLDQAEELRLRAAYADFMLTLTRREALRLTGAEQVQARAVLSQEMSHVRAVLRWLQERALLEQALQIVGELWRYWLLQGALSEGRSWFERLLALEEQQHGARALTIARACYGAGVLAAEQGDYERAQRLGQQAGSVAEQLEEPLLQAQALNLQGNIAKYQGVFAHAAQCFEQSLLLFRSLQQTAQIAVCLNNLATLAQERGDYRYARQLQEESLALKRAQGNQRGIAVALMNLGDIARDEGQLTEARQRAEECLQLFQQLSDEKGYALALNNLGEAAYLQGDYALAETCVRESLKLSRGMDDHWAVAVALHNAARLAGARGEQAAARDLYLQSLQAFIEEQSQSGIVECLEGLLMLFAKSDPPLSARLTGVAAQWRLQTGTPLAPVDAPPLEQTTLVLQTALGAAHFAHLMALGSTVSLLDAASALSTRVLAREE